MVRYRLQIYKRYFKNKYSPIKINCTSLESNTEFKDLDVFIDTAFTFKPQIISGCKNAFNLLVS